MADDDWQLEAIQEQFDVFEKLAEPCSSFAVTDLREINHKVGAVIKQQLRISGDKTVSLRERHISAELIKAIPENENNIHISYIVIVTNKEANKNLCKIPVFRVLVAGNRHTFVDTSGTVYKSWDLFLKNNDLPKCEFCYPINGCYDFKGKLKIDFALSPAAASSTRSINWWFVGGLVIGVVFVGASFYFGTAPIAFSYTQELIKIAEMFFPKVAVEAMELITEFVILSLSFKEKNTSVFELTKSAFNLLRRFYSTFKEQISLMWEKAKGAISAAYNYLYRLFDKYFKRASNESQHSFVATVTKVDKEMIDTRKEADDQLNEMKRALTKTNNPIRTMSTVTLLSYNQQIFQNCKTNSALQYEIKNQNIEHDNCNQNHPFKPTTENLLILSEAVSTQFGAETLSDLKDIFESLSCVVKDEYKNKIDNYIKGVLAARAAAGYEIDLDVYNESLGIVGDPKDHFMEEAMQSIQGSRLAFWLKEKIKELKIDTRIYLIPICKKSDDGDEGLYKTIGVRGKGMFDAKWLIAVLKESFIDFEESTSVVNETNSVIHIRTEGMSIFAYQEVNEENTSEGIVFVNRSY